MWCDPACKEECDYVNVLRSFLVHLDHYWIVLWVLSCREFKSEWRYGSFGF